MCICVRVCVCVCVCICICMFLFASVSVGLWVCGSVGVVRVCYHRLGNAHGHPRQNLRPIGGGLERLHLVGLRLVNYVKD